MTNKSILITVEWGYELHTCPLSQAEWEQICDGSQFSATEPYMYDGENFTAEWVFNKDHRGSLLVTYDDAGVGFDGALSDASISINGESINWV